MEIHEFITKEGTWQVLKSGENICIVDPMGRQRTRSKSHVNTAMLLIMYMGKLPVEPNLDESLRQEVKQFREEYAT